MGQRNYQPPKNRNRLSDRDILQDLLMTSKYMSHLYDHAIMEASDDMVRSTFQALQQDEQESAQMIFQYMQNEGWYSTGANRQMNGRRHLQGGQRLSGGTGPQIDSQYAVKTGARNFGQHMTGRAQQAQTYARANRNDRNDNSPLRTF